MIWLVFTLFTNTQNVIQQTRLEPLVHGSEEECNAQLLQKFVIAGALSSKLETIGRDRYTLTISSKDNEYIGTSFCIAVSNQTLNLIDKQRRQE